MVLTVSICPSEVAGSTLTFVWGFLSGTTASLRVENNLKQRSEFRIESHCSELFFNPSRPGVTHRFGDIAILHQHDYVVGKLFLAFDTHRVKQAGDTVLDNLRGASGVGSENRESESHGFNSHAAEIFSEPLRVHDKGVACRIVSSQVVNNRYSATGIQCSSPRIVELIQESGLVFFAVETDHDHFERQSWIVI